MFITKQDLKDLTNYIIFVNFNIFNMIMLFEINLCGKNDC